MIAASHIEAFRDGDAYRYGGDEFLIILADCTDEDFIERIGKWKEALHSIEIPDVTLSMTCSFGYEHSLLGNAGNLKSAIKAVEGRLCETKSYNSVSLIFGRRSTKRSIGDIDAPSIFGRIKSFCPLEV